MWPKTSFGRSVNSFAGASASSRMTWALVPLAPKALTAARRGAPSVSHERFSVRSSTPPADQSTLVVGWETWMVRGMSR